MRGRRRLADTAGIVKPETILQWCRRLVSKKYDGSTTRRLGRPSTKPDIATLVTFISCTQDASFCLLLRCV
jgi:hypothetical protein